jgi:hypothetical protein
VRPVDLDDGLGELRRAFPLAKVRGARDAAAFRWLVGLERGGRKATVVVDLEDTIHGLDGVYHRLGLAYDWVIGR